MRKWIRIIIVLLAILTGIVLFTDYTKLYRFVVYNFSEISDHSIFPSRPLNPSATPFKFYPLDNNNGISQNILSDSTALDDYLQSTESVAFIIIRNDSILYEKYFNDYTSTSMVASFSMAKSITSLLIGAAIQDGKIQSEEDLLVQYLPEMAAQGMEQVKLKHLLQMTSGLDFNESYFNPFGEAASFYYGTELRHQTRQLQLKTAPGTQFEYTSGNTQLLGLVLDRVLAPMTITAYLQQKIWSPLQMEFEASWSIDQEKDGIEKTFCCINTRALDFAKIGRLMLRKGNWDGQQLIPTSWIDKSTKADTTEAGVTHYKYQWWLPSANGDFVAQGHLGQYIYINPAKQLVIVRLGTSKSDIEWKDVFVSLAEKL